MVPGISEKSGGVTSTILSDRMGSMKGLSNAGTVTDTAEFDAFGKVVSRTGTNPTQKGFVGGAGYQEDGESGYKLLGHRYYDADTGRFLSRDPAFAGRNWYGYCHNNPLKSVDASGLDDDTALGISAGLWLQIARLPPWMQSWIFSSLGITAQQGQQYIQNARLVQSLASNPALDEAVEYGVSAIGRPNLNELPSSVPQWLKNFGNGYLYEQDVIAELQNIGLNAVRNTTNIWTSKGYRRPDIAVYYGDRIAYYIECKCGDAVRSALQIEKDFEIEHSPLKIPTFVYGIRSHFSPVPRAGNTFGLN